MPRALAWERHSPWRAYRAADGTWRPPRREGLARVLAKAGYGARPCTEALVRAGRLTVDGRVVRDPGHGTVPENEVRLDGEVLREAARNYLVLHKPPGANCRLQENRERSKQVTLPEALVGLEPAGRLASRSRGLLLLSNDLWWNTRVSQNARLDRCYEALVSGAVKGNELDVMRAGMLLPASGHFKVEKADVVAEKDQGTLIRLTMCGGHERQIRGAFSMLRHDLLRLARVALGPVDLTGLASGQFRSLTPSEIGTLAGLDR